MKRFQKYVLLLAYLVVVGLLGIVGIYHLAGAQSRELVGVVMGGYERFTIMHVESVLKRMANDPRIRNLNATACRTYGEDVNNSNGFLEVLSVGNKEGQIVCTAHENTSGVLPNVTDRLYFQRVAASEGMVVGEYAIARTTGKEVLHFAYPIRGEKGEFLGFVLAGVNLKWFINPKVDGYLRDQGVVVLGVDERGKLLFSYPEGFAERGSEIVTAEMVGDMLGGKTKYRFTKGYDGQYRVYAYKTIYQENDRAMLFLAGVSVLAFKHIALATGGVAIVMAALGWYGINIIWRDRKQLSSTRKR